MTGPGDRPGAGSGPTDQSTRRGAGPLTSGLTVGVDVGGTKVLAGVVDTAGKVHAVVRRPTPAGDARATARAIADVVGELDEEHEVRAVGVGAAGWIDATRSIVVHAPNLAWRNEPLRERVEELVHLPVVVENDANAAAWAEYRFGAGQGVDQVLLVTVGTGIGGGVVLGGRLHRGAHGMAGEFGHVRVVPDGRRCGCGDRGCLEQYASGRALVRQAREGARENPAGASHLLDLVGEADKIEGADVTRAALAGDEVALEAFAVTGGWLGRGLADLVSGWDPGLLIVGGGVAEAGELLVGPARLAFAEVVAARGRTHAAEIRVAAMGNEAGLVGAADLARLR